MATISFVTSGVEPRHRVENWKAAMGAVFGPVDIEPTDPTNFYGALRSTRRAGLSFSALTYRGHNLRRTRAHIARLPHEYFTLTRPVRGPWPIDHDGRKRLLEPGKLYLFDQSIPYRSFDVSGYETLNVTIPRARLHDRVTFSDTLFEGDLAERGGRAQIVSSFLDSIVESIEGWADEEAEFFCERLLDLVGFMLDGPGNGQSDDTTVRMAHRRRVLEYIDAHLCDPHLSPKRIAAANGISVRYLYRVVDPTGKGVAEHILERRLSRCNAMLLDRRHGAKSISEIAYRCGFNDASHFSRVFKARYGLTPRMARLERYQDGPAPTTSACSRSRG